MVASVLFNSSVDIQPLHSGTRRLLSMQQTPCHHAAKAFIHTADAAISTFRFSNLYIKNLLLARQTKI